MKPDRQTEVRVGGRRALKLEWTRTIPEPNHPLISKDVQYYVEAPTGYFSILILEEEDQVPMLDPIIARMLQTLSFLK